jgi:cell surface protein SprA
MILPTPNKRKSTVASDNGAAVVYIDDFDAAQRHISLGMNATLWSHSSQPEDIFIGANDSIRAGFRARTFWFQYFIPSVPTTEVWPNRQDIQQGNRNISPLHLVFDPEYRGIYNKNPQYVDAINPIQY